MRTAALLLVDDRPENLLTLRAILEPLGHELVTAGSGDEALRTLLKRTDFAAILLDVQMKDLDGFQTAGVIKQRKATNAIPIIFLTAISKDDRNVFRGYEVGAVDYVLKPFEPEILRAKVSVLVELWEKTQQIREQAELLAQQELAELRRASAERYRQLADAMPQIVWTADADGRTTYFNRRWFEYTGITPEEGVVTSWEVAVHPADRAAAVDARKRSLAAGGLFEAEFRFRARDGSYRWHLGRAIPIFDEEGETDFWIGTATDIDDRKRIEDAQRFLLDASAELSRSLDWRAGLSAVAELASARAAGRCRVDLVEPDGTLTKLVSEGAPRTADRAAAVQVAATGQSHLSATLLSVPIVTGGRVLGVITLGTSRGGRQFEEIDLRTAEGLAQRAATRIENAELYEEVERRARAARVLETIADGVTLIDPSGRVLLWNSAAASITGLAADEVLGRMLGEVLPGVPAVEETGDARPATVPLELGGRELWLSFSGVRFDDGTVYAFRDLTEERRIEQMRSDFVATVSHELRTPLAAIYGAAVTLRRPDLDLAEALRERLLGVVADESERLAQIVNDVLLASHLDSGQLQLRIETVDAAKVTEHVVDAARTHLPDGVTLSIEAPKKLPPVAADEQQLAQVLSNLVENAIKYSPDGGPVEVRLSRTPHTVRWTVSDRGLGIPSSERRRIFEKFYRLDPNMTRGIGGTGLGLYICRELVRRFEGRIWVEPNGRKGSAFVVELPTAKQPARRVKTAA